jgi:hypothetical protein
MKSPFFFVIQYYSLIYHEHVVSSQAFEELETLLAKHNICIAVKEKLVKDSGVADETAYDIIVQRLLTKPRARGEINYSVVTHDHTDYFVVTAEFQLPLNLGRALR